MFTIIIIFLIVATIFALATLAYVAIDLVLEKKQKEDMEKKELLLKLKGKENVTFVFVS